MLKTLIFVTAILSIMVSCAAGTRVEPAATAAPSAAGTAAAASTAVPSAASPAPAPPVAATAATPIVAPPAGNLPPFSLEDPDHIEKGRLRFGANCAAYCHGFEGSGGKTPAFRGRKDLDAQDVFKTITLGRTGSDVMPAWGTGFSAEKRWELVAYIMWLSRQEPRPPQ